ncbi:MAG: hypothetical protein SFU53_14945 [Terrimicrobiaceae bacterium]|nr:hypothetical protein [Terrimicrobiaceae bacterium]
MTFPEFFSKATGKPGPYDYQERLAANPCVFLLINIPTGLREASAAILAWLRHRVPMLAQEGPGKNGSERRTAAEKRLIATVVEDGLAIQDRFRVEPIYSDTGRGYFENRTAEAVEKARQERPK